MTGRKKLKISWGWFYTYFFMILLVIFTALPIVYMTATSLKPLDELFLYPPRYLVRRPTLKNFAELMTTLDSQVVPFTRYLFNSIFTTAATVAGTVAVCCLGAYAVEKVRMPGNKLIFNLVVAGLMFSPPAAQIPIYMAVSKLGMINSYWSLIIPGMAAPMYFFLVKQFAAQIPDSMIESARIDGAGEFRIFASIAMPMLKSVWSTVIVFSFIANWNNSSGSIIYITNQSMKTLPYALSTISDGGIARAGAAAAAAVLTTFPTIIVYLLMQARVLNTMAYAGIKG